MSGSTSISLPLAGVIPFSATDWPGHLTVTAFTQGCPLACPYCHNPALQTVGGGQPFESVLPLLEKRRGLIDALVISGGEPTMHAGLGEAISAVHAAGFPVGLHTCGYRPSAMKALLESSATTPDWVGLDVKGLPEDCQEELGIAPRAAEGCWETLSRLQAAGVDLQVRTTVWRGSTIERHVPQLRERVQSYGVDLVVQQARNVDATGQFRG
ncbi:anaerobic ribonucleoside-triphosphate reductase activating protein [Corynebacterium sp. H128]|uniref:anaerobic ribonucleoside-triphosphate reductase activating protein n=1 Tax=unclassified Corynebacterium TaxID=2624378 RepID=UPI00309F4DE1